MSVDFGRRNGVRRGPDLFTSVNFIVRCFTNGFRNSEMVKRNSKLMCFTNRRLLLLVIPFHFFLFRLTNKLKTEQSN